MADKEPSVQLKVAQKWLDRGCFVVACPGVGKDADWNSIKDLVTGKTFNTVGTATTADR